MLFKKNPKGYGQSKLNSLNQFLSVINAHSNNDFTFFRRIIVSDLYYSKIFTGLCSASPPN